ncbi:MAG TPA: dihydrolipoamide acetyltransferase family protein [Candidatus Dormibacteraeota bacterium]|jgi:pyruvate dehydrogenase E2 component (dihydrolipoamide acetyltransferase)|nr:dihydrolipoamide acetyltransferase family protein [Candidatus Dormibacteraeota bacterium]
MAHEVTMPQMGYDMTEGTINEWRVKEGDRVSRGDTIASIATDKADIDIEAYADGVLRKIIAQPGQTVAVGTVIAWIGEEGEEIPAAGAAAAASSQNGGGEQPKEGAEDRTGSRTATRRQRTGDAAAEKGAGEPEQAAAESRAGSPSGAATGQPSGDSGPDAAAPAPAKPGDGDAAQAPGGELAVPDQAATADAPSGNGRVKASPYARKRAAELGVDLGSVQGSGPGGRIVAQDVERALAAGAEKPAGSQQTGAEAKPVEPGAQPAPQPVSAGDDPYTDAEPSRLRRALARAMVEAKTTVPHFYLTVDVDAAPLLRLRAEVNSLGPEAPRLSVNDLIVRACALTLQTHPQLNAAWIDGRMRRFQRSNVSVAVALADGLIAPTLRNLDGISMRELAERLHDLVARAKSNRLRQEELSGGHMAVSNLGMFGIEQFSAIITPPQSSVLAVGAVRDEPVVVDGRIEPGKRMRLNLAVDHRVTDGAQGAEALARIRWLLEHPAALLV